MRKLVIKIILSFSAAWIMAILFMWQHTYAKTYSLEMNDTSICSCNDSGWVVPDRLGYDYYVNSSPGMRLVNQSPVSEPIIECIEKRANEAAMNSIILIAGVGFAIIYVATVVEITNPKQRQE